ncbi:type VI secretion system baseplate subunit TssG [Pseudomonas fulva]|uniref:type VI secretion system baseplate subunit TssG n=1 Tax=Pseudomonas fulva TaxID=47880 RepID=UPI0014288F85|nr:type VI secretion system baseplate subunit TssG [Pseudomonas fulva]NIX91781.1 type VI secretion system baseplate subunit TssG [Pseudomonas fulva]
MAIADRQATADLADTLLAEARNYDFFRLLEHLHHLHEDDLEAADTFDPDNLRVRLASYPGLGFPASDVALAERMPPHVQGDYRVQATFLGMHGPDSPLPGYYLDRLAYEHAQGIGIRPAFLDFFNHRLLTLLHQTWRKYRYYVRFRREAKDRFSRYVFSLMGLNDEELRGTTPIAWSRLLSYAGLIASRSRSPTVVSGIIAHCFDLTDVSIREFEQRYMDIPQPQRLALGKRNGTLGDNFVLGSRVRTRASKFTLVIRDLNQERFRQFLPSGENFARLRKLIDFLLPDPTAYDLELGLRQEEVPPFNLERSNGTHLGWTSFMDRQSLRSRSTVRIRVRS